MSDYNHYQTLDVSIQATPEEIKQAYRRMAKLFHPDCQRKNADPDKIVEINAAYEVLGDPRRRRYYDQQLRYSQFYLGSRSRQQRTAAAQSSYKRHRQTTKNTDAHRQNWLGQVYEPVNLLISTILSSLELQIDKLAADPFDDELMADFQAYLEECRHYLNQAQRTFRSQPNPAAMAATAANLYYCLNQLGDGIEELEFFTLNYDDYYLHTGQELFRIATNLYYDAQDAAKHMT